MAAYTYVVECADHSLYTGWTNDLKHRLQAHNGKVPGGAKYTKGRRPVVLYWYQVFSDKKIAQQLEYKFKKLNKNQKLKYMEAHKTENLSDLPTPRILQI